MLAAIGHYVYGWCLFVWLYAAKRTYRYWGLRSGLALCPPFQPWYHVRLLSNARSLIDRVLPLGNGDGSVLELFVLDKDPVYLFNVGGDESLTTSPAVVWRYWHAETRMPVVGFLHAVYDTRALTLDAGFKPISLKWYRVAGAVGKHSTTDAKSIQPLGSTPVDMALLSFLKSSPRWDALFVDRTTCPSHLSSGRLDCFGFTTCLKRIRLVYGGLSPTSGEMTDVVAADDGEPTTADNGDLRFVVDLTKDGGSTASTDGQIRPGQVIKLQEIRVSADGHKRVLPYAKFHYAVKMFEDTYISKCGYGGGVYVSTLSQTMGLYTMECALVSVIAQTDRDEGKTTTFYSVHL